MIAIDTNILVRYITQDNQTQAELAEKLIEKYVSQSQSIFINNIVLCELVWVLSRGYKYTKDQIAHLLHQIFATSEFKFEHHNILWTALAIYEKESLDFSDAVLSQINHFHGAKQTFTFDKNACEIQNFTLVH